MIGRERSRPSLSSKHASRHSAFTSHGCPAVRAGISRSASSVNACPVAAVCCASNAPTSCSVKSPSRSDVALMLKALPPSTMRFSAVEWMR